MTAKPTTRDLYIAKLEELEALHTQQLHLYDLDHPIRLAMEKAAIAEHHKLIKRPQKHTTYTYALARKKLKATGTDLFERTVRSFEIQLRNEQFALRQRIEAVDRELSALFAHL